MAKIYFKNLTDRGIIRILNLIEKAKPQKADAIVWLQGDGYDRGMKVLNLFRDGWAPKIVVSGNDQLIDTNKRPAESNISLTQMVEWLEKRGVKEHQIIIEKNSFNTKEQAKNALKLTQKEKWKKIILVTSLYHQLRAFLTFLKKAKEISWKGILINQPLKISWEKIPSGRKKKCKELFLEEIEKIKRYQNDIATIDEALFYFKK